MTQINYQWSNYTINLNTHFDLRYIYNTFHTELLKSYRKDNQHKFSQAHYDELRSGKHDRYEVEKAVNHRLTNTAREPHYRIRWKGDLGSPNQCIRSNEIDGEVKFRCGNMIQSPPSQKQGAIDVFQALERGAAHFEIYKAKGTV